MDELEEITICVEYELNGKKINYLPAVSEDKFNIKPIYKTFLGWKSSPQGIWNIKDLPEKAKISFDIHHTSMDPTPCLKSQV